MNTPLLSIIIPVYNVEQYIVHCMQSIIENRPEAVLQKIELVLVDDCSPDNAISIAQEYLEGSTFDNYKIIRNKKNLGLGGARNTGIKASSGAYLTFIDSDDYYTQNGITNVIEALSQKKVFDIYVYGFDTVKDGTVIWNYMPSKEELITGRTALEWLSVEKINPGVCNKVFKKSLFDGVQFSEHKYYEDLELTPQILNQCESVQFVQESVMIYRQDGDSITRQKTNKKHIKDLADVILKIKHTVGDASIVSNFFFNRWRYALKVWELDEFLFDYAVEEMVAFLESFEAIDFQSPELTPFADRLIQTSQKVGSFNTPSKVFNLFYEEETIARKASSDTAGNLYFSVIVPVYNAAKYLDKLMEAYLKQKVRSFELIFVNDCSTDASWSLIEGYMKKHAFVRGINLKTNLGAGVARNVGVKESRGEYLFFNDSDDWVHNNCLEEIQLCIANNKGTDLVVFPFSIYSDQYEFEQEGAQVRHLEKDSYTGAEVFELFCKSKINPAPWNKVFKKTIWTEHQILFTPDIHHQDLSTVPYACYTAQKAVIIRNSLYNYYSNKSGVSHMVSDKHAYSPFVAIMALLEHFKELNERQYALVQEQIIPLGFETILYNFSLRGNRFSDEQLVSFNKHLENFIKRYDLSLDYLFGSKKSFQLIQELVSELNYRGINEGIRIPFSQDNFRDFFDHYNALNHQLELLLTANSGTTAVGVDHKDREIAKLQAEKKWYADTYDHLPRWFLKIGAVFRRFKF